MGAPAATVEASGFICAIKGISVAAAPTALTTPVATKRKSRRVGSAADMVVTVSILSVSLPARPRGEPCLSALTQQSPQSDARDSNKRSPRTRGKRRSWEHVAPLHRVGLLAPLPAERKPANAAIAGEQPLRE